jgi:hypothetical protein
MAAKQSSKKERKAVKKVRFAHLQKLITGVCLLACFVVILGGLMSGARTISMAYLIFKVLVVVHVISWVLIRVLSTYEEMNSGQA